MDTDVVAGIDFDALKRLVSAPFTVRRASVHGPEHWRRVERNGLLLATRTGANPTIVRLFALFHDSRRVNDFTDRGHGARGAEYAAELRGQAYQLTDDDFRILEYACIWHTDGERHKDPTIATCWDADRLDLRRVGIRPDPNRMCTGFARELAATDTVEHYLEHHTGASNV